MIRPETEAIASPGDPALGAAMNTHARASRQVAFERVALLLLQGGRALGASHHIADLTLGSGAVVHDDLA